MPHEAAPAAAVSATPSLLRSGALSLLTSAAPLVVALLALPLLTRRLGTERLGLLALAWAWLGYATLLDFGLGRALTRMVAAADAGEVLEAPIGALVRTAHWLLTGVGAAVGITAALLAPWYIGQVLHVSDPLRGDAVLSAIIFALTVPAVTGASVPRAVLEARQQFRIVNLIRLPVSVGTFAVPVLLLPFTASLALIAATIAVLRVWAWWRYATLARSGASQSDNAGADRAHLPSLLRAGAWITVSNVLSPIMTVADRFLIGSLVSVSAVALYAVPWEAVTKLLIVPGAVTMVLFPAASRAATARVAELVPLYSASMRLVASLVIPACALGCLFAPWLLRFAGGAQYAGDSVTVLRVLCVGVAANSLAAVPFSLLQASGRAKWTAIVHALEVLPFVLLLWMSVQRWGIVGAAGAWTVRVLLDAMLMAWQAQTVAPLPAASLWWLATGVASVAACAALGDTASGNLPVPLVAATVVALLVPFVLWLRQGDAERAIIGRVGR